MKMTEYDLFYSGRKPALLHNPNRSDVLTPPIFEKIHGNFPFISGLKVFEAENLDLYFQTESQKVVFQKRIQRLKVNSREYHKELGLVLGFPPVAVEFFLDLQTDHKLEGKKAYYKHEGMTFIGSIDDKYKIAQWLCQNISPGLTKCEYKKQIFYIENGKDQAI